MREILFKAKRLGDGVWVEGFYIMHATSIEHPYSYTNGKHCIQTVPHNFSYGVDPETVCQYTGLTDKHERKIFEGDIVKAIYKPKDEDLTIDDFIIKWDKYFCKYVGHYIMKENVYNPLLFGSQTSFEVIGNIFDNPELIEK